MCFLSEQLTQCLEPFSQGQVNNLAEHKSDFVKSAYAEVYLTIAVLAQNLDSELVDSCFENHSIPRSCPFIGQTLHHWCQNQDSQGDARE